MHFLSNPTLDNLSLIEEHDPYEPFYIIQNITLGNIFHVSSRTGLSLFSCKFVYDLTVYDCKNPPSGFGETHRS